MIPERIIHTSQLTKDYGSFRAVDHLNLSVRAERITGFLGRNGAGKSSTIKMLLGMISPSSGSGTVVGCRIGADPKQSIEIRRRIAYVGEEDPKGLYGYMTVAELIRFTRSFYNDWAARDGAPPSCRVPPSAAPEGEGALQGDAHEAGSAACAFATARPADS